MESHFNCFNVFSAFEKLIFMDLYIPNELIKLSEKNEKIGFVKANLNDMVSKAEDALPDKSASCFAET